MTQTQKITEKYLDFQRRGGGGEREEEEYNTPYINSKKK